MATMTFVSEHRSTGCDEKRVTMLVTPAANGSARKLGAVGPYILAPAQTIVLDTDNGGNETITFDAAAGSIDDTTAYPCADQAGLTVTINVWPRAGQIVTFAGATTTAALVAANINAQIAGARATVTGGGQVRITNDVAGTSGAVTITAGTSGLTFAAPTAGTGDVANIRAVTATEAVTRILADTATTLCYQTADGRFMVMSPTAGGAASELDFTGGTALTAMGLAVETIVGTAGVGGGYVAGGEVLDLTGYFTRFCYGGRIISGNGVASGGVKWDIICDPAAAISAVNVTLAAHVQSDPGGAGGADVFFVEETARLPHQTMPLMVEFWGV